MIGEAIRNFGEEVSGAEGYIESSRRNVKNQVDNILDRASYLGEQFEEQTKGLWNSFEYNSQPDIVSGEVRPLHPNMFWQFTGAKFIGVTRIPQTISKGVTKGHQLWKQIPKITTPKKPSIQLKLPRKIGKSSMLGKPTRLAIRQAPKVRATLQKTKSAISKNPKKSGLISGTLTSLLVNLSSMDSTTELEWLRSKKKRKSESWLA